MAASFPRQLVNAATVFVQERRVSRCARETEQSRETIYRDARQVRCELAEGPGLRRELELRIQDLEAEVARLLKQAGVNKAWREQAEHRLAQAMGKERWYQRFTLRICQVEAERTFERDSD